MMSKNRNKKWVVLESLLILLLFSFSRAYADGNQEYHPDCEKGDAIFRRLRIIYNIGHCGIYLNSDNEFTQYAPITDPRRREDIEDINEIEIKDSDPDHRRHSVIQANGTSRDDEGLPLSIATFEDFMGGHSYPDRYWGAYNNGNLNYEDRRRLVLYAWQQRGCTYWWWSWPKIKKPTRYEKGRIILGSFRCDGLVEYCYEQIGVNGGEGFFTDREERDCLFRWIRIPVKPRRISVPPTFHPAELMRRMEEIAGDKAKGTPPKVEIEGVYLGEELAPQDEYDTYIVSNTATVKVSANDGEYGSGIDRVELWEGSPDDTPYERPGYRIDFDDHDVTYSESDENHIYQVDWDTLKKDENGDLLWPDGEYTIYAKAFDQAGNTKVSEGVSIRVENKVLVPGLYAVYSDGTIIEGEGPIDHGPHDPGGAAPCYYQGVLGLWAGKWGIWGRFSETLTGYLYTPVTGYYTFTVSADDYGKLWINDIVIAYVNTPPGGEDSGTIYLEGNEYYPLRLDYKNRWGSNWLWLEWFRPDGIREIIPRSYLYHEKRSKNEQTIDNQQLSIEGIEERTLGEKELSSYSTY